MSVVSLVESMGSLVLDTDETNCMIICGLDIYKCNKAAFVSRSPYFQIACSTAKAIQNNRIIFPEVKRRHIRAMMHFLQVNAYYGPLKSDALWLTPCEINSEQRAGVENGLSIEFRSKDCAILQWFPEFEYGWTLHGHKAVKTCKIITHHELFNMSQEVNSLGFECTTKGDYRCEPGLLPLSIQIPLFAFLRHLKHRRTDVSINPVFHAEMFHHIAIKYMLWDLIPHIVSAFREGCQAWINTSLIKETSFITAAKIILRPILRPRLGILGVNERGEVEGWEMADALVRVMAANWGWMRWDEDILTWLRKPKYRVLRVAVEEEVEDRRREWEGMLVDAEAESVWGDQTIFE